MLNAQYNGRKMRNNWACVYMCTFSTNKRHREIGAFYPTLKFDEIALNHFPKNSFGERKELLYAYQTPDFQAIIFGSTWLNKGLLLINFWTSKKFTGRINLIRLYK